jgi:hypothetical protein
MRSKRLISSCLALLGIAGQDATAEDRVDLEPGKSVRKDWKESVVAGVIINGQRNSRFLRVECISILESREDGEAAPARGKSKVRPPEPEPEIVAEPTPQGIRFAAAGSAIGGTAYTVSYKARFEPFTWRRLGRAGNWVRGEPFTESHVTTVVVTLPRKLAPIDTYENTEKLVALPETIRVAKATSWHKRLNVTIEPPGSSIRLHPSTSGSATVKLTYHLAERTYESKVLIRTAKKANGDSQEQRATDSPATKKG